MPKTFGFLRQLVIPRLRFSSANSIRICSEDRRSAADVAGRLFARHETAVYLFIGQHF
jgi:hypothetical protein